MQKLKAYIKNLFYALCTWLPPIVWVLSVVKAVGRTFVENAWFFAILKQMYLENELADPPLFLYQKIAQKPTYRLVLVRHPWKIFWRQKWQNPKKQFFFKNWLNN